MADPYAPPPEYPLPTKTDVVTDEGHQRLFTFDGALPLPIGTRIRQHDSLDFADEPYFQIDDERFPDGKADAVVVNVRMFGLHGLILDGDLVKVTEFDTEALDEPG